jgi:ribosome-associated toxin RatA of RatAB toxin-antitoxin module
MGNLDGESTAEIDAPLDVVWALVEDVEKAPGWQGGMKALRAVERDDQGRAVLCEAEVDGKVRTLKSTIRFAYSGAPNQLTWRQEKGDLKAVIGSWTLEDLGGDRTRATYKIEVDLGRLSLVIRGPLVGVLRGQLAGARASELKGAIERG